MLDRGLFRCTCASGQVKLDELRAEPCGIIGGVAEPLASLHAIGVEHEGDPNDMAGWYRLKMLTDERGAETIVRHLRAERDKVDNDAKVELLMALHEAYRFFEKRRPMSHHVPS